MGQDSAQENPEELLLHMMDGSNGKPSHQNEIRQLVEKIKEKERERIADDLHRADRPAFAATEDPDLVVRTTRAIDIRLAMQGSQAPYYVAPGQEDPDRFNLRQVVKGREYFRTHTGMFNILVEQVIDEKPADWSQFRLRALPEGIDEKGTEAHALAVQEFVGKPVDWTGEKTASGFTFTVTK